QAEDGIRDFHVTGVQTCALPIYRPRDGRGRFRLVRPDPRTPRDRPGPSSDELPRLVPLPSTFTPFVGCKPSPGFVLGVSCSAAKIGRASCRDGVQIVYEDRIVRC